MDDALNEPMFDVVELKEHYVANYMTDGVVTLPADEQVAVWLYKPGQKDTHRSVPGDSVAITLEIEGMIEPAESLCKAQLEFVTFEDNAPPILNGLAGLSACLDQTRLLIVRGSDLNKHAFCGREDYPDVAVVMATWDKVEPPEEKSESYASFLEMSVALNYATDLVFGEPGLIADHDIVIYGQSSYAHELRMRGMLDDWLQSFKHASRPETEFDDESSSDEHELEIEHAGVLETYDLDSEEETTRRLLLEEETIEAMRSTEKKAEKESQQMIAKKSEPFYAQFLRTAAKVIRSILPHTLGSGVTDEL